MPCYQAPSQPPSGNFPVNTTGYATEAECLEACGEGACCNGTTCSVKPQCQCNAEAGEVFNGVGTTCPCTFGTMMRVTIEEQVPDGGIASSPSALGTFDLAAIHDGCIFQEYRYVNERGYKRVTRSDGLITRVLLMDVGIRILYSVGQWRILMYGPSLIEENAEEGVAPPELDNYLTYCPQALHNTVGFSESLEQFDRGPFRLCQPYSTSFTTPQIYASCNGRYPYAAYNIAVGAVLNPLP